MQLVIDIPKKLYDRYKEKDHIKRCDIDEFEKALDSCIILPKGHGRLIDAKEYEDSIRKHYFDNSTVIRCTEIALDNAPTIIEANKGDKE